MKTAALLSGITLLGLSAIGAGQETQKNSDAASTDKSSVSPATPGETKEAPVPPVVAPSTKPLPSELITTSLDGKEVEFLMTAIENGLVLEWLSQTAKEKAQDERLKAVGIAIAGSQTKENKVIQDLAKSKGVSLRNDAPPVQQSKIEAELGKASGSALDKVLTEHIVAAAKKAVVVYEKGVQVKDEQIKNTAEEMLPLAKKNLQLVSKVAVGATEPEKQKRPGAGR